MHHSGQNVKGIVGVVDGNTQTSLLSYVLMEIPKRVSHSRPPYLCYRQRQI